MEMHIMSSREGVGFQNYPEYSIEWFKEHRNYDTRWLGYQAVMLLKLYEKLEKENEWKDKMLSKAYSFIVDHAYMECECNRCQWIREYNHGYTDSGAQDQGDQTTNKSRV
jgi:hypothetical protein